MEDAKEKFEKAKLEAQQAQAKLQETQKPLLEAYMKEYEELCKKHGFRIVPQVSLAVAPLES